MSDDVSVAIIVGDESLLVKQAVSELLEGVVDPGLRALNFAEFAAPEADGALAVARTQPMMARRRVVVIRDMDKASVGLLDALLEYVEAPNPSTLLVLTGHKLPPAVEGKDRGRRIENRVRKTGLVRRFKSGDQGAVPFAIARAREAGCVLDSGAARLLVELVGSDLGTVCAELDKSIAYVGGQGTIDAETVARVSSMVAEAVIWDLTDALVRRDRDAVLAATHRLLDEAASGDGEAHRLLAMITWQIRQLLELQSSMRHRSGLPGSWRRVPSRKVQSAQRMLRRHPMHPARVFDALAQANRLLNSSRAGYRRVFESLMLDLTA